jgi:hypothetical protein
MLAERVFDYLPYSRKQTPLNFTPVADPASTEHVTLSNGLISLEKNFLHFHTVHNQISGMHHDTSSAANKHISLSDNRGSTTTCFTIWFLPTERMGK